MATSRALIEGRSRPVIMVQCNTPGYSKVTPAFSIVAPGRRGASHVSVRSQTFRAVAGLTDMLIRTPELGRALAETLGNKSAALMRGHGAVVVAGSLHLVVGQAYYLNLNARLQLQAMQLGDGTVTYLDREEAKKATQDYERSWEFWKSRLPRQ